MDSLIQDSDPLDDQNDDEFSNYSTENDITVHENIGIKKSRRSRCPNFTTKEIKLLDKLAKIYSKQINNKCTKMTTTAVKNRAWEELTKDFNAAMAGETYRTVDSLKKRHENNLRGKKSKVKYESTSTKEDDSDNDINNDNSRESIDIEVENFNGVPASFVQASMKMHDSDNEFDEEEDGRAIKELIRVHITRDPQEDEQERLNNRVDGGNQNEHHGEIKNHLPNGSSLNQSQPPLNVDTRPNLLNQQKMCFLAEHRMRIKQMKDKQDLELKIMRTHMQEKHDLELKVIRIEHSERLKIMREEHFKKMKMLELEESVGMINKI